jgi:hypothetical protein
MFKKMMFVALVGLAMSATYAEAGVRISIGIGIPLFVPIGPPPRPVYVAPVYVAPAPVYAPAPIYVQPAPRPVYVQPAPVYGQPAPVPIAR